VIDGTSFQILAAATGNIWPLIAFCRAAYNVNSDTVHLPTRFTGLLSVLAHLLRMMNQGHVGDGTPVEPVYIYFCLGTEAY
jgi:hypothetical protein